MADYSSLPFRLSNVRVSRRGQTLKILKAEFDKLRQEIEALAIEAHWLETYSLGLRERCKLLKAYMDKLEDKPVEIVA